MLFQAKPAAQLQLKPTPGAVASWQVFCTALLMLLQGSVAAAHPLTSALTKTHTKEHQMDPLSVSKLNLYTYQVSSWSATCSGIGCRTQPLCAHCMHHPRPTPQFKLCTLARCASSCTLQTCYLMHTANLPTFLLCPCRPALHKALQPTSTRLGRPAPLTACVTCATVQLFPSSNCVGASKGTSHASTGVAATGLEICV